MLWPGRSLSMACWLNGAPAAACATPCPQHVSVQGGERAVCVLCVALGAAQELMRYCTMDVLEPAWRVLEERLRRAADVDEVRAS